MAELEMVTFQIIHGMLPHQVEVIQPPKPLQLIVWP